MTMCCPLIPTFYTFHDLATFCASLPYTRRASDGAYSDEEFSCVSRLLQCETARSMSVYGADCLIDIELVTKHGNKR